MKMHSTRVATLLYELCVELGFCLPAAAERRLKENPPTDVEEFADVIFLEEGVDPIALRNERLRKKVRKRFARHIRQSSPPVANKHSKRNWSTGLS
jgi:hypothetical protein